MGHTVQHLTTGLLGLGLLLVAGIAQAAELNTAQREALVAIRDGDPQGLEALIDGGLSMGFVTSKGQGPVAYAVKANQPEMIATVVAAGADLETRTSSHETPLHLAVIGSQPAVVEALLAAGAEINAQGGYSYMSGPLQITALAMAVRAGDLELVRILLQAGADASVLHSGGRPLVELARDAEYTEIAALLEQYSAPAPVEVASTGQLRPGFPGQDSVQVEAAQAPAPVAQELPALAVAVAEDSAPAGQLFGTEPARQAQPERVAPDTRLVYEVRIDTVLGGPLASLWTAFKARHADWNLNDLGHITRLDGSVRMVRGTRRASLPSEWAAELYQIAQEQGLVASNPDAPYVVVPMGG